jgi:hypothetical protein
MAPPSGSPSPGNAQIKADPPALAGTTPP